MTVHEVSVETGLGRIRVGAEGGKIVALRFEGGRDRAPVAPPRGSPEDAVLREASAQLRAWVAGKRNDLDLPLAPRGTPFQRAVWEALLAIPAGETRSYGQIAAGLGRPSAARAVGAACGRNPIGILVPCHRAVGAGGELTGYAWGLERKAWLLERERGARPGPARQARGWSPRQARMARG